MVLQRFCASGDLRWQGLRVWHPFLQFCFLRLLVQSLMAIPAVAAWARDEASGGWFEILGLWQDPDSPGYVGYQPYHCVVVALLYAQWLGYDHPLFIYVLHHTKHSQVMARIAAELRRGAQEERIIDAHNKLKVLSLLLSLLLLRYCCIHARRDPRTWHCTVLLPWCTVTAALLLLLCHSFIHFVASG